MSTQQQLQYLKKIITDYTQEMADITTAFVSTYGFADKNKADDYDYGWFEEWHYNYAQEQYERRQAHLLFEDYDRLISYRGKSWRLHTHDPHWLFTSEDNILIEVYYSDIRCIDVSFLLSYASSLQNNRVDELQLDFIKTADLLDQLVDDGFLKKRPCHHSGCVYILNTEPQI